MTKQIKEWFDKAREVAANYGWEIAKDTTENDVTELTFRFEAGHSSCFVTMLAYYNEDTKRYSRSAFITTAQGNRKLRLKGVRDTLRVYGFPTPVETEAAAKAGQPAAGTRVQGEAAVGQKVTYFDIANQDGAVWEVVSRPEDNVDPDWGWTKGYQLRGEDGTEKWSDLRQYGWTFA